MKMIVGLGNPGEKYQKNRHNVGFILLDEFANRHGLDWEIDKKHKCERILFEDTIYIKPQNFMNNSGGVVSAVANFYKISYEDITVINDDVDLEFGRVKHQKSASSAGHRGVEDIIQKLGTNDFWRFRIGIGRSPDVNIPTDVWVLMNFSDEELEKIKAEIKVLP